MLVNDTIDRIGDLLIKNIRFENISVLKKIQESKNTNQILGKWEYVLIEYPELSPLHISLLVSFLALIYQNKPVQKEINSFLKQYRLSSINDTFIIDHIGFLFIEEAEIVGGMKTRFKIPSQLWLAIIGLAFMFYSYITYNQIQYMTDSIQKNKVFLLMKDIHQLPTDCVFEQIELPKEQQSFLNIVNFFIPKGEKDDLLELALKYRQCILDPNRNIPSEALNKYYSKSNKKDNHAGKYFSQFLLSSGVDPIAEEYMIDSSVQKVQDSSTLVKQLVPLTTIKNTVKEYNQDVFQHIFKKVGKDLEAKSNVEEITVYINKITNMSPIEINDYLLGNFQDNLYGTITLDSITNLFNDFTNVMNMFSSADAISSDIYKKAIHSLAGMSITDMYIREMQTKLNEINTQIKMTSVQSDYYIKQIIIDLQEIMAFIGSFWFLLQKMSYVFLLFLSTAATLHIKMKNTKPIENNNSRKESNNTVLQIENTIE
jgi:hypothetical protein